MRNAFAALARWLAIGIGSLPIVSIPCSAQSVVDPTLQVQTLTSGLTNPTTMAFIGPGDILVLQKNDGRVRRVINGVLQAGEVLDVAVDNDSERGLLGIALHPAFPGTSFVYLYYTQSTSATTDTSGSPLANRVYRYTWNGSALVNPSLIISLPVTPGPNHNGGIIAFGPDGKLYAVIGDLNRNGQLQNYATSATPDDTSVILRLNDDGTIPADNPFFAQGGNLAKYYAYGIRNSFGLTFDPVTGKLWMTENGPSTYDEINQFDLGSNSGWERIMGPVARDAQGISDLFVVPGSHYSDPKFSWLDTVGPTAIAFLNSAQLGAAYQNNAFVGDINNGRLYRFRPNATRDALVFADPNLAADRVADSSGELTEVTFGTGFGGITDVKVGPDGLLYIVSYGQGKIFTISLAGGSPDLIETAVGIPAAAAPGATIAITDTVQNQGPATAGASTTRIYLSLDVVKGSGDTLLAQTRSVPSLAGGAASSGSTSAVIPSATPVGNYYVIACADDTNAVAESSETNNCLASSTPLQVTRPDLVEISVGNPPAFGLPGGVFAVSDTVKNNGVVGAKGSSTRYWLSSDTVKSSDDRLLSGSRAVPALAAGATSSGTVNITVPAATPLGVYHLLACADDTQVVIETSETNNCIASAATVQITRPDLLETAVSNPPANPLKPGDTFAVTDTVKNQGNVNAAASTTRYSFSPDTIKDAGDKLLSGSRSVPILAPQAVNTGTKTVQIPSNTLLGTYYLLACADDPKQVVETNENNNCIASATKVVVTRPDLVETTVSNPPANALAGSSFVVTDTAHNNGAVSANASTTRYHLSPDALPGSDRLLSGQRSVGVLGPGASSSGSATVTIPSATPAGSYYLLACADNGKVVAETDETNNCRVSAGKVMVAAP